MKFATASLLTCVFVAQNASAHYIFKTLLAGSKSSTQAVREPQSVEPIRDITSTAARCNLNPSTANETVSIAAGDKVGFQLSNFMYHQGPVAIYLGKAPGKAQDWDGSGQSWFKIEEWGANNFNPISFSSYQKNEFVTTVPGNTPPGEYLVRIENLALHLGTGVPEIFISCAQVKITGSGTGNPSKVSIPGYIAANDPNLTANIYSGLTSFTVPGPVVWRG
ncbi:hypothetical protein H1R20_g3579, partial [Candolleomyces eurysporus]